MNQLSLIISIVAGLLLGAVSNWIYDLLKNRGFFPDKPGLKHVIIVILACLPLLLLVALPELMHSTDQPRIQDATIKITQIAPSVEDGIDAVNVETPVLVTVEYYLPEGYVPATIELAFTSSFAGESYEWRAIDKIRAEWGTHLVELSGVIQPPSKALLNGQPFQIGVFLGDARFEGPSASTIAYDTRVLTLSGQ